MSPSLPPTTGVGRMAGHTAGPGGWEALARCAAFGRCGAVTITVLRRIGQSHDATPPARPSPPSSCRRGRRTHARAVRRPRTQADRVPPLAWGDGGWQGAPPGAADAGAESIAAMEREEEASWCRPGRCCSPQPRMIATRGGKEHRTRHRPGRHAAITDAPRQAWHMFRLVTGPARGGAGHRSAWRVSGTNPV